MKRLLSEFVWLAPFIIMGLFTTALFRSEREVGPPVIAGAARTIIDSEGGEVTVPATPVVAGTLQWRAYLPFTQAPELPRRLGDKNEREGFLRTPLAWVFLEVAAEESRFLWNNRLFGNTLEAMLAEARPEDLYFYSHSLYGYDPTKFRNRFGILTIRCTPGAPSQAGPVDPAWLETESIDGVEYTMLTVIRVMNAAIGKREFGETLVADFIEELRSLSGGLRPETIPPQERPRVMHFGSLRDDRSTVYLTSDDDERAAARGAIGKYRASGRYSEAERVLAIDPDIVMGNADDLYSDQRWRGLTAVMGRRVYDVSIFGTYNWDIDHRLLHARWRAELFHLERYPAGELRELIRKRYRTRYRYEISEDQIDELLNVRGNSGSVGYERFMRNAK